MRKLLLSLLVLPMLPLTAGDPQQEEDATNQDLQKNEPISVTIPVGESQTMHIQELREIIVAEKLYRFAREKQAALEIIRENKYLGTLFVNIIKDNQVYCSSSAKSIKQLLQEPECRSFLLQMRNQFSNTLDNFTNDNIQKFQDSLMQMLAVLSTFEHPLVKRIANYFYSFRKLHDLFNQEVEVLDESTLSRPHYYGSFVDMHNIFSDLQMCDYRDYCFCLKDIIHAYENKREEFLLAYAKSLAAIPQPLFNIFLQEFNALGGLDFLNEKVGGDLLQLLKSDYTAQAITHSLQQAEEQKKAGFLPQGLLESEEKKRQKRQKRRPPKKKKRKKVRRKKSRPADAVNAVPERTKKVSSISEPRLKSPGQSLQEKISSYYPGMKILALLPQMVRFVDTINNRTFELYNATGNTEHCEWSQFDSLARLPLLHPRIKRWSGDLDKAIQQVEAEAKRSIVKELRQDWIRKHQLPAVLLYHFRKMGYEGLFHDKSGSPINSLYLVGRLKEDKGYRADGYFGFGFLPNTQQPTIYHACFESKPFRSILVQDKELTDEQKANLSQAFRLKDKASV